ncbi:hypothetical protein [Streptomyces sp. NPDC056190]|uniref:hypothetical protein n=1 Tax=Streptomyces sp. NPDC056190 TaxID=3345741 RepID=UPI0035DBBFB0
MADTVADLAGRIAALERLVRDLARSSRLANSSIENGSLSVYDELGLLRGSWGLQDDGTIGMAAVNGPPPPVPSTPTITSVLGGVAVTWNGSFADGSDAPADFSYVEVHFSPTADFADDKLFAAFYSATGGTMTVPAGGPLWVRLVCVSTSGVESEPSQVAGPTGPLPVVAQEVLDGIVNELSLADGAVTRAKLEAGAVDRTVLADGAVTTPKLVAGQIEGLVLAVGTVNADRLVAASITAAQVKALSLTGDRLAFNTVTADQLATGTITAASGVISSIDASVITVGKIKASQLDAGAVDGKTITGAIVRAVRPNGSVAALMAPDVGDGGAGFRTTSADGQTYAQMQSGEVTFGARGVNQLLPTGMTGEASGGTLHLQSGVIKGGAQAHIILASGDSPLAGGDGAPYIALLWDGSSGPKNADMVVDVSGILLPRNMEWGRVNITPVANVPTSVTVSGLNVRGKSFTGFATPVTTVPGTTLAGVGVSSVSGTSLIVWVTRANTAATTVGWAVYGR